MSSLRYHKRKHLNQTFSPDYELTEFEPEHNRIHEERANDRMSLKGIRPYPLNRKATRSFSPTDDKASGKNIQPRVFKSTFDENGQIDPDSQPGRGFTTSVVWYSEIVFKL